MKRMLAKNKNWRTKFNDNDECGGITTSHKGQEITYKKVNVEDNLVKEVVKRKVRRAKNNGDVASQFNSDNSLSREREQAPKEKKVVIIAEPILTIEK
jgi:hypothetical protein